MQPLSWYLNRLRSMSPGEISWRVLSGARDAVDRYRIPAGRFPSAADSVIPGRSAQDPPAFRVCDVEVGAWMRGSDGPERDWAAALVAAADAIARHELTFFDLRRAHLGDPIRWNYEPKARKPTPVTVASSIDYRDYRSVGDCKLVWEPNRHHHLVVLGRAFRATGDRRYAEAVVEQLQSWLDQCPFGHGMNWRSPLELGVRLINWVWAIDMIRESGLVTGAFLEALVHSSYLHAWEIGRKLSRGSSGNNHLTGELAGLYVAATYFPQFPHREQWRAMAASRLHEQLRDLAAPDGGWGEHAIGYQLFVLQFFLIAGMSARAVGEDYPADYWARIERMLEFVAGLLEAGPLPLFGDADDGYVLDLGSAPGDPAGLLAAGAVLFANPRLKAAAGEFQQMARWLLPADAAGRFANLPAGTGDPIASRAFAQSGYYLLQSGTFGAADRLGVFMDCAELGFGAIAAHGHADALSFTLRAFGRDLLVDPGTYDYFTYPAWRTYFRSTRAHNTVAIDGRDQSEMLGPFLWGRRATVRLIDWTPVATGGRIAAEHDGYADGENGVVHRRAIELDANARTVIVRDELLTRGAHQIDVYFHAAPDVTVEQGASNEVTLVVPEGQVTLTLDPRLDLCVVRGAESPMHGWFSPGYHRKLPASTIIATGRFTGTVSFASAMVIRAGRAPGRQPSRPGGA